MRAKFKGGIIYRIPHLINVISHGNGNQTGIPLRCFVEAVNQYKTLIDKVSIIDASYLMRHYATHKNFPVRDQAWDLRNHESLKQLALDATLTDWLSVLNHERYPAAFDLVQTSYTADPNFTRIVDELADQYQHKADLPAARNYLLDECAGALCLVEQNGTLTYPGELNLAIRYTLRQHLPEKATRPPIFIRYQFKTPRQKNKRLAELASNAV